jgi:hypothetical protein
MNSNNNINNNNNYNNRNKSNNHNSNSKETLIKQLTDQKKIRNKYNSAVV